MTRAIIGARLISHGRARSWRHLGNIGATASPSLPDKPSPDLRHPEQSRRRQGLLLDNERETDANENEDIWKRRTSRASRSRCD